MNGDPFTDPDFWLDDEVVSDQAERELDDMADGTFEYEEYSGDIEYWLENQDEYIVYRTAIIRSNETERILKFLGVVKANKENRCSYEDLKRIFLIAEQDDTLDDQYFSNVCE